jgi:ribosomal-protein-alanine N-acetyltransferase
MTLVTTPYERRHRETLLNLMFYSRRTHIHLDWHKVGQWLDLPDVYIRIVWLKDNAIGFMGVSMPVNQAAWIRVMALHHYREPRLILRLLWDEIQPQLTMSHAHQVGVLAINQWLEDLMPLPGFTHQDDVVTLFRAGGDVPPLTQQHVRLHDAYLEDLPNLVALDHAAFLPPWQMSTEELRQALRIAASATLATLDNRVVGYQISTRHHTNGHLARLAVAPDMQGQRIGSALLDDLIRRFSRRGVRTITVNTQRTNRQSQRLYERYGFHRNGYDLPVWLSHV